MGFAEGEVEVMEDEDVEEEEEDVERELEDDAGGRPGTLIW
jgi:hypothetical protein|tara:strand:+ start:339 stop:461 length:123 start_codon:yes stop_codon:yes gene_type:complete